MTGTLKLSCFALFFLAFAAAAQTNGPVVQFGESHTLHSKLLAQDRAYWVCLPSSYQANTNQPLQKYPVLYLLDAEWNFYWVCPVVQFMEQSRQIPEFIVVGIPNMDRDRDLTPTPYPNMPSSGGGPLFERFLNEELAPELNTKFRTVSYRLLVGHSAGGALAADAFLRQTNGFQGYIAIDPALGWVNQDLIRRAKEFVPLANSHAAIFIATAGWRDLNPTNIMTRAQEIFASILRTNLSTGVRVRYEVEAGDHNSSRLLGFYNGLRFIFEGYEPMDPDVLNTPLLINEHFEQLSSRLGFTILPPEGLVLGIGYQCLHAHETNNAIDCFKLNVSNYPTSAYAHKHLADVYLAAGKKELAIKNYKKALELDPNTDGVKDALENLR
ncbi:MAG TPA: alpha/beta hydrolase-fold protein [Candidatus Acidoferrales bacterium]|nr:alpha/beta hydrolase-fold protein [Candidatus Acidoferrales bacterium]